MPRSLPEFQSFPEHDPAWALAALTMPRWVAAQASIADIHVLHPRALTGENYSRTFISDTLAGARSKLGCQLVSHGPRHVERTRAFLAIERVHSGFSSFEFSDGTYVQRPGQIVMTDYMNAFRASHHRTVSETIWVPRRKVGLSDLQPMTSIMIEADSDAGRGLAAIMKDFFDSLSVGRRHESRDLETLVRAIIRNDFHPASDRDEWWRGRKKLIRKYIETHLEDPKLAPLQICQLFNMSRATLYRMFELDGGVRRFIQDRRLLSAIWDLAASGTRRGRMSRVAERWGFSSDANFNRAARAAFGMPPGAFFRTSWPLRSIETDASVTEHPLRAWFEANRNMTHRDKVDPSIFIPGQRDASK